MAIYLKNAGLLVDRSAESASSGPVADSSPRPAAADDASVAFGLAGAHLPEAFERGAFYSFHRFPNGWIVHAPCPITETSYTEDSLTFFLAGWGERPYHLLVAGVRSPPTRVPANNSPADSTHHPDQALLVVKLRGPSRLEIHPKP